jgi:hypothetical protein
MTQASAAFQMRHEDGRCNVYVIRADGIAIPKGEQRVVYTSTAASRSQLVCDALNNNLLTRITNAVQGARIGRGA